jgi:RNA-binding protein
VSLTPRQRAYLRSLAHHLDPVVHVGKEGVGDATVRSVHEALNTRELIKVKVQEAAPQDVREAGAELEQRVEGSTLVQTIGRVAVLYRPHPEKPEIRLPKPGDDA